MNVKTELGNYFSFMMTLYETLFDAREGRGKERRKEKRKGEERKEKKGGKEKRTKKG